MKIIRQKSFECNSSSSHSIAFDSSVKTYDTIPLDEKGNITLSGGEFGWSWEKFVDPLTKANYCAVDQENNSDNSNRLKEVLIEHTGAKEIVFSFNSNFKASNWSYIDHESVGTSNPVFQNKETLKEFIFGNGVLFTGNDNSDAPPNFLDLDKKYDYEIILEDVKESYKLTQEESEDEEFLTGVLRGLFDYHKDSYYGQRRPYSSWNEKTYYEFPYFSCVDYQNKCFPIRKEKVKYENGKYIGTELLDEKILKFEIKAL